MALSQKLTAATRESVQRARDLVAAERPDAALVLLRLALGAVQAETQVSESDRAALTRQVRVAIQHTVRQEEEIALRQAEAVRLAQSAAQRSRDLDDQERQQESTSALMSEFAALMSQAQTKVPGLGRSYDSQADFSEYSEARDLALQARAQAPAQSAPRSGALTSQAQGFLTRSRAHEDLKETRALMTLQDVERASIPGTEKPIEYPPVDTFRAATERRVGRYDTVSLTCRDPKTVAIERALAKPLSMPFGNETSLGDVLKYIRGATRSAELPDGIPIYVDPIALQEEEKTLASQVTIDLEGVPLKKSLTLLVKQLGLSYTVKDGLVAITSPRSLDQLTDTRIYPVADLSIIPNALMGGSGMRRGGLGGGLGNGGAGGGIGAGNFGMKPGGMPR
jgi:hypothetical protein